MCICIQNDQTAQTNDVRDLFLSLFFIFFSFLLTVHSNSRGAIDFLCILSFRSVHLAFIFLLCSVQPLFSPVFVAGLFFFLQKKRCCCMEILFVGCVYVVRLCRYSKWDKNNRVRQSLLHNFLEWCTGHTHRIYMIINDWRTFSFWRRRRRCWSCWFFIHSFLSYSLSLSHVHAQDETNPQKRQNLLT